MQAFLLKLALAITADPKFQDAVKSILGQLITERILPLVPLAVGSAGGGSASGGGGGGSCGNPSTAGAGGGAGGLYGGGGGAPTGNSGAASNGGPVYTKIVWS